MYILVLWLYLVLFSNSFIFVFFFSLLCTCHFGKLKSINLSIFKVPYIHVYIIYIYNIYIYIYLYILHTVYIFWRALLLIIGKEAGKKILWKKTINNLFFGHTNLWVIWHKKHLKAHNCYKSLLTLEPFWNFLILSQQTWKIFLIIWLIMFQNLAEAILKFCFWNSNINSRR